MTPYHSRILHLIPSGQFGAEVLIVQTHQGSSIGNGWDIQQVFGPFADLRAAEQFLSTSGNRGERGVTLTHRDARCELGGGPIRRRYSVLRCTPVGPAIDLYEVFNG